MKGGDKVRTPDIETAVLMYYEKTELTTADIKKLFEMGNTQAAKIKKQVKQTMAERGVKSWLPNSINTKVAYEVWGINIEDYERRLEKLKRLKPAERT